MTGQSNPTLQMAARYLKLFVNRRAFTVQTQRPNDKGKHYYFRPSQQWFARQGWPEGDRQLCPKTVLRHLTGEVTIALYAINPRTQRSKWVAVDGDYSTAFEHLTKLQWQFKLDDVHSALERSRRGAHLWFFAATPLLASKCRIYVCNIARRLTIPIKIDGKTEGIEIFPRQDSLDPDEFGNAIRGPLGVHRGAAGKRFWFYDAAPHVAAQLDFLDRLPKLTPERLDALTTGLTMPEDLRPRPALTLPPYNPNRREFHILDYVSRGHRSGKDYRTTCPSCARSGHDKQNNHLAICIADPRRYRCWAGCTKQEIRAAVGRPIREFTESRPWQTKNARA